MFPLKNNLFYTCQGQGQEQGQVKSQRQSYTQQEI